MKLPAPPQELALTGRVKDWLESSESRLPVSCTVFSVEDSMEGDNGIEASWLYASYAIRNAAGVSIDLSKLRGAGTENGKGLVSSGAASFAKFYSLINQELRRGGIYKNGGISVFLDHDHPDVEEFLKLSPNELPWAKKTLYVDENIKDNPLLPLIAEKVNNGTLWLAKKSYDEQGNRLYSNLCLEILIPSRGTCLLSHVNLGQIVDPAALPRVFRECAEWLCQLHGQTGIGNDGYYLAPEDDKQVGLGVIGLANFLAIQNVTYAEFTEALEAIVDKGLTNIAGYGKEYTIAYYFNKAYQEAAKVGRRYNMERLFCIAPTASSSFRYEDAQGFTTTPEISPPIDYEVERDSATMGVTLHEYHPQVEIAKKVGWSTYWRLVNVWQRMMDNTGLAHSISMNVWSQIVVTPDWIVNEFMPSSAKTTYYRFTVDSCALDKSEIVTPDSEESKLADLYETQPTCMITPGNDPNFCEACAG